MLPSVPPADPGRGRATGPTAIALPAESGSTSFEIPDEFAGQDVLLIVSAMAEEGPYLAECSVGPGAGDGTVPDILTARTIFDRPPRAIPGSPAPSPTPPSEPKLVATRPPLRREFAVMARAGDPLAPSSYDLVDARLRAVGERIQVFVDEEDVAIVSDETLRRIVSTFESHIDPILSGWIGHPLDVDGDGRFSVLLSRRIARPYTGRCHIDGYFRGTDLDIDLPRPLSNRADLIYLNAELQPDPYLETVLAHEYAHAVLESRRRAHRAGPIAEQSWLDEALAHLCEDRVARSTMNLDYRVAAFLADPGRYRLRARDEHHPWPSRTHGNRGAAYLFLRWCAETFDPDLPRSLTSSGETGPANLEAVTGLPFTELHRGWTVALALESLGRPTSNPGGLNLLDGIGDWPLGGVHFEELGPDDGPRPFSIEGTGSTYLRLSTLPDGPTRVQFRCDPAANPQLTAILVGSRAPRIALDISLVSLESASATVIARVEEQSGVEVRLDRLSWEPLSPAPELPRAHLEFHQLRGRSLESLFPSSNLSPHSWIESPPFAIPIAPPVTGPLIFRVAATSSDGDRIVAWAELDPSQQDDLASRSSSNSDAIPRLGSATGAAP